MTAPSFDMRQLLEAGVHFGHQTHRWNPKMEPYLYGVRNGIHIIDLQQTAPLLYRALDAVRATVAGSGRVLFVGTKRQAQTPIAEAAKRCGQYYVNHRWLGGMLTNWRTISNSIGLLRKLDEQLDAGATGLTKKELLNLTRKRNKLERTLGGIREMGGLPDLVFIVDTNKEDIARKEAVKLGIPVFAIVDSNSDPEGIRFPAPGNDDSTRAILFYCDLVARAVLDGLQQEQVSRGSDIGASAEAPVEPLEPAAPPPQPAAENGSAAAAEAPPAELPPAEPPASETPAASETPPVEQPPVETPPAEPPAAETAQGEPQ